MSTPPPPTANLNTLPEEILSLIVAPLLPLKWYSLSALVSLSHTSSYLRQWLMEDDTLWQKALLGRGIGRPLHTIPGFDGFEEYERNLRGAWDDAKRKKEELGRERERLAREKERNERRDRGEVVDDEAEERVYEQREELRKKEELKRLELEREALNRKFSTRRGHRSGLRSSGPLDLNPGLGIDPTTLPPLPILKPLPLTWRDLSLRTHAHESKCVNCKVADSKLSHYYLTDAELRPIDRMGVSPNLIDQMPTRWGRIPFEPMNTRNERILTNEESSTRAVRTAKFFVGYDFFGFCHYTLPIRTATKSEPLTVPPIGRAVFTVFVPSRHFGFRSDGGGGGGNGNHNNNNNNNNAGGNGATGGGGNNNPTIGNGAAGGNNAGNGNAGGGGGGGGSRTWGPEVVKVSEFMVENYGGITLGDFQRAFDRWAQSPITPQEQALFERKGFPGMATIKGKKNIRAQMIPNTLPGGLRGRYGMDDKAYEVGDVRPLGYRIEGGRGAILLGDRYSPSG